ncbi:MAG: hypothetical protein B7Z26_08120 [Asticcacaulis sp. 32-58-5]|nr:MAG: hypothetical protein B7Z26_08120 [Asticcacaulis sp. 32-58-5]
MGLRFLVAIAVITCGVAHVGYAASPAKTPPTERTEFSAPEIPPPPVFWKTYPTGDQALDYYPDTALDQEIPGSATLECRWDEKGRITNCDILKEAPDGYGFGDATRRLLMVYGTVELEKTTKLPPEKRTIKIRYHWTLEGDGIVDGMIIIKPTLANAAPYYPAALMTGDTAGIVSLWCHWKSEGGKDEVTGCDLWREFPKNKGFGQATIKLRKDKTRIYSTYIDEDLREGTFPVFFLWYLPEPGEFD